MTYTIPDSNGSTFLTNLNEILSEISIVEGVSSSYTIPDSNGSTYLSNLNEVLSEISTNNSVSPAYTIPDSNGSTHLINLNTILNQIYVSEQFNPTNFVESVKGLAITPVGNPVLSKTWKKFGTSSLYLYGEGGLSGLSVVASEIWNIAANDGGFDFWTYNIPDSSNPTRGRGNFVGQGDGPDYYIAYTDNNGAYNINSNGGSLSMRNGNLPYNTETHLEFSQLSGVSRVFANGILVASGGPGLFRTLLTSPLFIGYNTPVGYYSSSGYIDELRFFSAEHAHTSNFTPPTQPYSNSDALALFHFDG